VPGGEAVAGTAGGVQDGNPKEKDASVSQKKEGEGNAKGKEKKEKKDKDKSKKVRHKSFAPCATSSCQQARHISTKTTKRLQGATHSKMNQCRTQRAVGGNPCEGDMSSIIHIRMHAHHDVHVKCNWYSAVLASIQSVPAVGMLSVTLDPVE
jgi:hypothetical protein